MILSDVRPCFPGDSFSSTSALFLMWSWQIRPVSPREQWKAASVRGWHCGLGQWFRVRLMDYFTNDFGLRERLFEKKKSLTFGGVRLSFIPCYGFGRAGFHGSLLQKPKKIHHWLFNVLVLQTVFNLLSKETRNSIGTSNFKGPPLPLFFFSPIKTCRLDGRCFHCNTIQ